MASAAAASPAAAISAAGRTRPRSARAAFRTPATGVAGITARRSAMAACRTRATTAARGTAPRRRRAAPTTRAITVHTITPPPLARTGPPTPAITAPPPTAATTTSPLWPTITAVAAAGTAAPARGVRRRQVRLSAWRPGPWWPLQPLRSTRRADRTPCCLAAASGRLHTASTAATAHGSSPATGRTASIIRSYRRRDGRARHEGYGCTARTTHGSYAFAQRTQTPPCPHGDAAGRPADRLRHRARPAIPAAQGKHVGRDRVPASAHRAAAGRDQGRRQQRAAVPVGRLGDAAVGGGDDRQDGADPGRADPGAHQRQRLHRQHPDRARTRAAGRDDEPHPLAEARRDGHELPDLAGGEPVDAVGARLRRRRSGRTQRHRRRPRAEPSGRADADRPVLLNSRRRGARQPGEKAAPRHSRWSDDSARAGRCPCQGRQEATIPEQIAGGAEVGLIWGPCRPSHVRIAS